MSSVQINEEASEASYPGAQKAAPEAPMVLVPLTTVKKPKTQAPQDTIDEFWAKFTTKNPGKGM